MAEHCIVLAPYTRTRPPPPLPSTHLHVGLELLHHPLQLGALGRPLLLGLAVQLRHALRHAQLLLKLLNLDGCLLTHPTQLGRCLLRRRALRLQLGSQPPLLRLQALRGGLRLRQAALQVQDGVGGLAPLGIERLGLALELLLPASRPNEGRGGVREC